MSIQVLSNIAEIFLKSLHQEDKKLLLLVYSFAFFMKKVILLPWSSTVTTLITKSGEALHGFSRTNSDIVFPVFLFKIDIFVIGPYFLDGLKFFISSFNFDIMYECELFLCGNK